MVYYKMYMYPRSLQKIIDSLKLLPGVGEKTAERYAFSILSMNDDQIKDISETLGSIKQEVVTCPICGCISEKNNCLICKDDDRASNVLCVVENAKNVFVFEKLGVSKCKYHVLGGLISPVEGINPEDLSISKLISRVSDENISEVILALRPGIEGNTTTLYIKRLLEDKNVKITQIAQGVPIGTDMEYLDNLTLELALQNRSEL